MQKDSQFQSAGPASSEPPYIRGWPLLGQLPGLTADLLGRLRLLASKGEGVVRFNILSSGAYLISSPDGIKDVLTKGEPEFRKGPLSALMRSVFGNPMALADGDQWRRKRKILQPLFLNRSVKNWRPIVERKIREFIKNWETQAGDGLIINVQPDSKRLILDIMTEIMFGTDLPDSLAHKVSQAVMDINNALLGEFRRNFILRGPLRDTSFARSKKLKVAIRDFNEVLDFSLHTEAKEKAPHLVSMFRDAAVPETGDRLSEQEVRDEASAFFFAGLETTSNALCWAFYYLALHPDAAERIAREQGNWIAESKADGVEGDQLSFTRQFVYEVLRIKAPAFALERFTTEDTQPLQGCPLQHNRTVILAPAITHLDEKYWNEPSRFDPERFSKKYSAERHPFAFFPFGGGARKCIGMNLAMMELVSIIGETARKFELSLVNKEPVSEKLGVTLKPGGDIHIRISPRKVPSQAAE